METWANFQVINSMFRNQKGSFKKLMLIYYTCLTCGLTYGSLQKSSVWYLSCLWTRSRLQIRRTKPLLSSTRAVCGEEVRRSSTDLSNCRLIFITSIMLLTVSAEDHRHFPVNIWNKMQPETNKNEQKL